MSTTPTIRKSDAQTLTSPASASRMTATSSVTWTRYFLLLMRSRLKLTCAIVLLLCFIGSVVWLHQRMSAADDIQTVIQPTSNGDLQRLVQSAIERASPAVVCIAGDSGTIISADGYVLSEWHVTHADRRDGDSVQVILASGKETTATLVAGDRGADVSVAKIDAPGPFPYLPLDNRTPRLGDYAIKLGHPGSLHPLRGSVARLGRVISIEPNHVATDCLSIGGDSGGPFINLNGELLGMVDSSVCMVPGSDVPYALHSALTASRLSKVVSRDGTLSSYQGVLIGPSAMTLTPAAELAPIVEHLLKRGSRSSSLKRALPQVIARSGHWPKTEISHQFLPHCDWMSGPRHANGIAERVGSMVRTRSRVVEFYADSKLTKRGFFIDEKHVLTRASGALAEERALLNGRGEPIKLSVVATDDAFDLMLLKTDAQTNHAAIDWLDEAPSTGTLLVTPATAAEQWTVGIVSVSLRTPQSVHGSTSTPGGSDFYDSGSPPDAEFPAYFDTDLHLYANETGLPVFDVNGKCVGIAIRSSHIGARVIPAKAIKPWLEFLELN